MLSPSTCSRISKGSQNTECHVGTHSLQRRQRWLLHITSSQRRRHGHPIATVMSGTRGTVRSPRSGSQEQIVHSKATTLSWAFAAASIATAGTLLRCRQARGTVSSISEVSVSRMSYRRTTVAQSKALHDRRRRRRRLRSPPRRCKAVRAERVHCNDRIDEDDLQIWSHQTTTTKPKCRRE